MRRPSPAIIIAGIALFIALGGTSMAATGYQITSLWQIAPKVRHALRGHRGPRGFTGAAGPQGSQGVQGIPGPQGPVQRDPSQLYIRRFSSKLDQDGPLVAGLTMQCDPNDTIVTGGFDGQNEVVTTDNLAQPLYGPWFITAHLDPNPAPGEPTAPTSGSVSGWVLCQRA
jgi:hypothetical protein